MSASVNLYCEEGCELAISEDELSRVFDLVLSEEGVERTCLVSVSVLGEQSMQALNGEWRGIEAPTDVISLECERPDDPDLGPEEPCELGDIAMAPAVLAAQSARFGTTPADETRLMAIHSLLHLLGYDHIEGEPPLVSQELRLRLPGLQVRHQKRAQHQGDARGVRACGRCRSHRGA